MLRSENNLKKDHSKNSPLLNKVKVPILKESRIVQQTIENKTLIRLISKIKMQTSTKLLPLLP